MSAKNVPSSAAPYVLSIVGPSGSDTGSPSRGLGPVAVAVAFAEGSMTVVGEWGEEEEGLHAAVKYSDRTTFRSVIDVNKTL